MTAKTLLGTTSRQLLESGHVALLRRRATKPTSPFAALLRAYKLAVHRHSTKPHDASGNAGLNTTGQFVMMAPVVVQKTLSTRDESGSIVGADIKDIHRLSTAVRGNSLRPQPQCFKADFEHTTLSFLSGKRTAPRRLHATPYGVRRNLGSPLAPPH
jgi:hypothetical protein